MEREGLFLYVQSHVISCNRFGFVTLLIYYEGRWDEDAQLQQERWGWTLKNVHRHSQHLQGKDQKPLLIAVGACFANNPASRLAVHLHRAKNIFTQFYLSDLFSTKNTIASVIRIHYFQYFYKNTSLYLFFPDSSHFNIFIILPVLSIDYYYYYSLKPRKWKSQRNSQPNCNTFIVFRRESALATAKNIILLHIFDTPANLQRNTRTKNTQITTW